MSVWVEIALFVCPALYDNSHAPRERVSWNFRRLLYCARFNVTLHVSVWVEIFKSGILSTERESHAPRERVSWNADTVGMTKEQLSHAPRERVSWNVPYLHSPYFPFVTLHVSVWVEIKECFRAYMHFFCHAPRERVSQLSFQRRTYRYWIIQITAWLRSGGIFIPEYYTFFMCFPSISPIPPPQICANKWFII